MKSCLKIFLIFCILSGLASFARVDNRTYMGQIQPAVWQNPRNIKVYITPDETKEYLLTRGFNAWDSALGSNLNFKFVDDKSNADISIKFVEASSGNAVGLTKVNYTTIDGRIYLKKAKITISRKDPMGLYSNDVELYKVILHEIGHAIGILGHSKNIFDVMYYSTASQKNNTVSSRDVDTVKKLYNF